MVVSPSREDFFVAHDFAEVVVVVTRVIYFGIVILTACASSSVNIANIDCNYDYC